MATIIIKNSTGSSSIPSSLQQGELAINTVTGKLFYGSGSGNAVKVLSEFPYTGSAKITGSLTISGGLFVYNDITNNNSLDTLNRNLIASDGGYSIDWGSRQLIGNNGFETVKWSEYVLADSSRNTSIEWDSRLLYANDGTTAHIDWSNPSYMQLSNISESSITNVLGIDGSGRVYYTASSAIGGGSSTPAFPYTGSAIISGSLTITGSTTSTLGFTGSLFGTASWVESASQALTASFVRTAQTASYILQAVSASFATTSSFALTYPYTSTSSIIGNGLSSSFNINHGFNTRNLHITVYESSSNGETVYPDIRRINANTASIIFANPPSSLQYIVYISQ